MFIVKRIFSFIIRYFLNVWTFVSYAVCKFAQLFDFTRIETSIYITCLCQTCVITFNALFIPTFYTSIHFIAASLNTNHKLLMVGDTLDRQGGDNQKQCQSELQQSQQPDHYMITDNINYSMPYHSDIEHALLSFASTFAPYNRNPLTQMAQFSTGLVFAQMLATVDHFPLTLRELEVQTTRWIQRLTNLKKIVQKVELYVGQSGKSVRTKDIDLIQIAKHDASEHIQRLFELVIAVFMQSPHKQDYIQTIMRLDERSQHALVVIVQNAIDERLTDSNEGLSQAKIIEHLQELTNQNQLLKQELQLSNSQNQKQKRQIIELRQRLEELEYQDQKQRRHTVDANNEQTQQELDQLKAMNDNLRQKLFQTMRENQSELNKLREENIFLQNKLIRFKEYEEAVQHLKEQLAEAQGDRERTSEAERQKRRQTRLIQEKDAIIAKLKQKIDEINEKNYCMQENQLTMKMELERKEFRFKQLENDVKNRLKAEPFVQNAPLVPETSNTAADAEELDYLQEEVEKLRNNYRQLERENLKLKKKIEKSAALQGQKKKLQKIILDVSKSKEIEIEMLLVSLYDLRSQNIRLHQMLKTS